MQAREPTSARRFVGIDGGATKTRVVVTDATDQVHGEGWSGPSNYQVAGPERATQSVAEAVTEALIAAQTTPDQIHRVVAGMAGLDGPNDVGPVRSLLAAGLGNASFVCDWLAVNDSVAAWAGALQGQPGAIVISGSGAIALAVNAEGHSARCDGWGHWLGDEGSGFDIGRRGLRAALRAVEGRGPDTVLLRRLMTCHSSDLDDLRGWVALLDRGQADAHRQIKAFAREVVQAAAEGDGVARQIVFDAGEALACTTVAAVQRAGLGESSTIATVGSLFTNSPLLWDAFRCQVEQSLPGAQVIWPQQQPAEGAALLARRPELRPEDVLVVQGKKGMNDERSASDAMG